MAAPVSDPAVFDTEVAVIGSGFGGSVTALRLAEKDYRVTVFEAGRRFADHEFASTSWDRRRFLGAPMLGMFGIQRFHVMKDVAVLAGARQVGPMCHSPGFPGARRSPRVPRSLTNLPGTSLMEGRPPRLVPLRSPARRGLEGYSCIPSSSGRTVSRSSGRRFA